MSRKAAMGIVAAAVLLFGVSAFAQDVSLTPPLEQGHPNLESRLDQLVKAYQAGGMSQAESFAHQAAIELINSLVRVEIEANTHNKAQIDNIIKTIKGLGGKFEIGYEHLVQALVPIEALGKLAGLPEIRFVQLPMPSVPDQGSVISQGVGVIGADKWQQAGITGEDIKVAVLDLGFRGLSGVQGRGELPTNVVTRSFRADGNLDGGTVHGTGVAEIVHDVAPAAQLFLVNYAGTVERLNAIDFLLSQGVHVINHSISVFSGCYQGEGGILGPTMRRVRQSGVLWVNSAGNRALQHWQGDWRDDDGDDTHNFEADDETQTILARGGDIIQVELSWNDPCEASANDYDLFLLDGNLNVVARSSNIQDGNDRPREFIAFEVRTSGTYHISIRRDSAARPVRLKLFLLDHVQEYQVPEGSLAEPAISPNVLAAGATFWRDDSLEEFSSQGPTADGRIKPDITAPDGVANASFSRGFFGTSASSPHTAGAAALVKQAFPTFTPDQIQQFLEQRAEDLGPPGKDNQFGAGRLNLGPVPGQQPALQVSPTSLSFSGQVGGPNPPSQTLTITNTGAGTLNWTAAANVPWLSVSPTSGSAPPPATVTVSVDIAGLPAGTHSGQITITASGATGSPATVQVTLTLTEQPPVIQVSPSSLNFTAIQGEANPPAQTLTISNAGGGTLNWTASANAPWLGVSPASGSAPPPSTATVSVNIAGLPVGQHQAQITLSAVGATNSPVTVPVTLTITPTQPPGALLALKFIKLEFVNPPDWERTLKEGCVVYKNISGGPSKLKVTPPDNTALEFDIGANKEAFVCGDVVHIDARGAAAEGEWAQSLTLSPGAAGDELLPLKFMRLEFTEPAAWERTLSGGCVIYKNANSASVEARVTRPDHSLLEFDIPAGKAVLACGDIVLIDPYNQTVDTA